MAHIRRICAGGRHAGEQAICRMAETALLGSPHSPEKGHALCPGILRAWAMKQDARVCSAPGHDRVVSCDQSVSNLITQTLLTLCQRHR